MTRNDSDIDSALVRFDLFRRDNPEISGIPIVISTYFRRSSGSDLVRIDWVRWIDYDEQIGALGERALIELRGCLRETPQLNPIQLRDYQCEDLTKLEDNIMTCVDTPQRALFYAVMGYGKSLIIANWAYRLHMGGLTLVVIATPILKLVSQLTNTIQNYIVTNHYTSNGKTYNPIINIFASQGDGATTDTASITGISEIPTLIITTYASLGKLLESLPRAPCALLLDEVHRCRNAFTPEFQSHIVGFTATPTATVTNYLTPIVKRKLSWAIKAGWLVDYRVNAFIWGAPASGAPEEEVIPVAIYTEMIIKILREGHASRLLSSVAIRMMPRLSP